MAQGYRHSVLKAQYPSRHRTHNLRATQLPRTPPTHPAPTPPLSPPASNAPAPPPAQLLPECGRAVQTRRRHDRNYGSELARRLQSDGNAQSVINLRHCAATWGDIRQTPVCCRSNPRNLARAMCSKWSRVASSLGMRCETTTTRIQGGEFAQVNEFPHMVSRFQVEMRTGIDLGLIFFSRYSVRVGIVNLKEEDSQTIQVLRTIRHPLYKAPASYHDIALLQLATKVQLSKRVMPACLPTVNGRLGEGRILTVAGWGRTETADISNVLLKGFGRTLSRFKCDDALDTGGLNSEFYRAGITDSIICLDESSSGACQGDSGGPLTGEIPSTCQHVVFGVVSKGSPSCQATTVPGIYTNVEHYIQWIVDN
ncbi:putative transmembrane protease serine 9-like, partial [Penaeus vannamei]